jgi:hypothetical protein
MRGGSIIHSVRHIVLALMIALLPLRGWVGDAMAGQMLQQQLAAINSEAADVDFTSASGSFNASVALHGQDCEGHMGGMDHSASMGDMAASDCVTCPPPAAYRSVFADTPKGVESATVPWRKANDDVGVERGHMDVVVGGASQVSDPPRPHATRGKTAGVDATMARARHRGDAQKPLRPCWPRRSAPRRPSALPC